MSDMSEPNPSNAYWKAIAAEKMAEKKAAQRREFMENPPSPRELTHPDIAEGLVRRATQELPIPQVALEKEARKMAEQRGEDYED